MPQYYVAIEPPFAESVQIAGVMRGLGVAGPIPHITIIAPPDLSSDLAWLPIVRNVAEHTERFNVAFGEPRTFHDRILYLSVESPDLGRLHERMFEGLTSGLSLRTGRPEQREFIPHLTLKTSRKRGRLPPYDELTSTLRDLDPFVAFELSVFRRADSAPRYQAWTHLPFATD